MDRELKDLKVVGKTDKGVIIATDKGLRIFKGSGKKPLDTSDIDIVKVVGQTDKSVIIVTDKGLKILRMGGSKSVNALGVVTLIPGVQLELGRGMEEFTKCLRLIRKPLAIQKIAENDGNGTWHIIRLSTGNVPEARICTINTINEIIAAVSFNQSLVFNTTYRRYQQLSTMHQLAIGEAGKVGQLSQAVIAIAAITGEEASNFKIVESAKSIIVYTTIRGLVNQYKYTFLRDQRNYYSLLSVAFMANKSKA